MKSHPNEQLRLNDSGARVLFAFASLMAFAAVISAVYFDSQITSFIVGLKLPGDVKKGIQLAEAFAHGSGVIVILTTLWWIDIDRQASLWRVAMFTLSASLIANLTKYMVPRTRPHSLEAGVDAFQSWHGFLNRWATDSAQLSFPSGHSATVVAMAIGLSIVYPRGKWIFTFVASVACFQRIFSEAHHPSDVFASIGFAALLGCFVFRAKPNAVAEY